MTAYHALGIAPKNIFVPIKMGAPVMIVAPVIRLVQRHIRTIRPPLAVSARSADIPGYWEHDDDEFFECAIALVIALFRTLTLQGRGQNPRPDHVGPPRRHSNADPTLAALLIGCWSMPSSLLAANPS